MCMCECVCVCVCACVCVCECAGVGGASWWMDKNDCHDGSYAVPVKEVVNYVTAVFL